MIYWDHHRARFPEKSKMKKYVTIDAMLNSRRKARLGASRVLLKSPNRKQVKSWGKLEPLSVNPGKKIQNAGPSPSVFSGKKIHSAALDQFVYVSVLWIFFQNHAR